MNKFKNEIFQIIAKGIATNKIYVTEYENYKDFKKALIKLKKQNLILILTTNKYTKK